jgi:hypothetical protein
MHGTATSCLDQLFASATQMSQTLLMCCTGKCLECSLQTFLEASWQHSVPLTANFRSTTGPLGCVTIFGESHSLQVITQASAQWHSVQVISCPVSDQLVNGAIFAR